MGCDNPGMTFTAEQSEQCFIYMDPDDALSLGASVEVEDLGDELLLSRPSDGAKLYAGPDAQIGLSNTGKVYAQVPLLRRLASMPRGEKLPADEWDSIEGALLPAQ